jgi:VanZ family protein
VLVGGYGVADELHQARVPGRDASAFDVLTDVASAVAVLWIVRSLGRSGLAERTLVARLGLGALACMLAAGLALLS